MAVADLNRLFDLVRIRLPGSLDAAVKLELFALVNDFFQGTNLWYEDITFDVIETSSDRRTSPEDFSYDLVPSMGAITRLGSVMNSKGFAMGATMPVLGTVILSQSPGDDDTYKARCYLTVSDPVTRDGIPVFPAWVLNKYGVDLLDGLLGRMMMQAAKPYSNMQLGAMHAKKFANAVAQAKVEALHQNVYRGQNWRFPQTYQVRRYRHT